jgi:uncharacterized Zn-binding protein involved in type VI secretion
MGQVVRLGDTSDHGGKMITATGGFTVDDLPGCVSGDMHQCPQKGHGTTSVMSSSNCTGLDRAIIRTGDFAGCGARIVVGSGSTTAE